MTVKELIEMLKLGKQYAMEEVVNNLWTHLGFVLQWAKYGLKK